MKRIFTLLIFCGNALYAMGQKATMSGQVTDDEGPALIGANLTVQGNPAGAVTDIDGNYEMMIDTGTYKVIASYIGFRDEVEEITVGANEKVTLKFRLGVGTDLDMVVVSGSRRPEKLTESAATLETIFAREIEQFAGSPAELVARR